MLIKELWCIAADERGDEFLMPLDDKDIRRIIRVRLSERIRGKREQKKGASPLKHSGGYRR